MSAEVKIRPGRTDELETLVAIKRADVLDAFGHIHPPDRQQFPKGAAAAALALNSDLTAISVVWLRPLRPDPIDWHAL